MINGLLEIDIMNAIWDLQDENEDRNISVSDIVSQLAKNGTQRAYTTIKTVMDRLSSKDMLVRYKSGKKFYYRSAYDREEVAREALNNIATNYFDSSYLQMIKFAQSECEKLLALK